MSLCLSVSPCHSCVIRSFACSWVRVCLLFQCIISPNMHQSIVSTLSSCVSHFVNVSHSCESTRFSCHRMCVPVLCFIQHVNERILDTSQCENHHVGIFIMCSVCVNMFALSKCVCYHTGAIVMSELIQCVPKSISPCLNGSSVCFQP